TGDNFEPRLLVTSLIDLVKDKSVDAIGLNVGAIHALWTLHGVGALDGSYPEAVDAVKSALKHPSAGVRRNAIQVLPDDGAATAILKTGVLKDTDLRVRMAALLRLADCPPSPSVAAALVDILRQNAVREDRGLTDAWTIAAAVHAEHFLATLAQRWGAPLTGEQASLAGRGARDLGR